MEEGFELYNEVLHLVAPPPPPPGPPGAVVVYAWASAPPAPQEHWESWNVDTATKEVTSNLGTTLPLTYRAPDCSPRRLRRCLRGVETYTSGDRLNYDVHKYWNAGSSEFPFIGKRTIGDTNPVDSSLGDIYDHARRVVQPRAW